MKKLIIATTIAAATFASIGAASAGSFDPYTSGYNSWEMQALSGHNK